MSSFNVWYERNKESFNEKRRRRYAEDPAYRERAIKTTRSSRKKKPKPQIDTVTVGELAAVIGRDVQTIRAWEEKGYIPRTSDKNGYRVYTPKQVELMKHFSAAMESGRYAVGHEEKMIVSEHLREVWNDG